MVKIYEGVRRPQLLAQFLAGDNLALPFEKEKENLKWLFLQSYSHTALAQLSGGGVYFVHPKPEDAILQVGSHRSP